MFRFPNTDLNDDKIMKNILECCLNMIESHTALKKQLEEEKMPELNYKISISYGSVKVAQSTTSTTSDIFGPTVNRCFKITIHYVLKIVLLLITICITLSGNFC